MWQDLAGIYCLQPLFNMDAEMMQQFASLGILSLVRFVPYQKENGVYTYWHIFQGTLEDNRPVLILQSPCYFQFESLLPYRDVFQWGTEGWDMLHFNYHDTLFSRELVSGRVYGGSGRGLRAVAFSQAFRRDFVRACGSLSVSIGKDVWGVFEALKPRQAFVRDVLVYPVVEHGWTPQRTWRAWVLLGGRFRWIQWVWMWWVKRCAWWVRLLGGHKL